MQYQTYEASFQDEIRGIPCGLRTVEAAVGRKWVSVRQPGRGAHRIPLRVWVGLGAVPVKVKRRRAPKGRR